ncbi:hypothetical protein BHE74_00011191, partial [Ensete ventricosum]
IDCDLSSNFTDKKASYQVTVEGVEINPNPVVRGQPAIFKISAITGNLGTGFLLVSPVLFLWINLLFIFFFHISQGSYTLIMKILGEQDKQLTCFNFDFSIGFTEPDSVLLY